MISPLEELSRFPNGLTARRLIPLLARAVDLEDFERENNLDHPYSAFLRAKLRQPQRIFLFVFKDLTSEKEAKKFLSSLEEENAGQELIIAAPGFGDFFIQELKRRWETPFHLALMSEDLQFTHVDVNF